MKNKKFVIACVVLAVILVIGSVAAFFLLLKPNEPEEGCWYKGRIYKSGADIEQSEGDESCLCTDGEVFCDGEQQKEDLNGEEEREDSVNNEDLDNSTRETGGDNEEKTVQKPKANDGVEYVWYEDNYIKFKYPKGWNAEVESGKYTDDNSDFEGVRSIELYEGDTLALSVSGLYGLGMGGSGSHYFLDKPKEIYNAGEGQYYKYVLNKTPYTAELSNSDDIVISYIKLEWIKESYDYDFEKDKFIPVEEGDMHGDTWYFGTYDIEEGKDAFIEYFLLDQKMVAKEAFITGRGKIYGSTDNETLQNTEIMVYSELSNEDEAEFNKYVKIFGEFFDSIERK